MPATPDRAALLAMIDTDPALSALLAHVDGQADGDATHDLEHLLRVTRWTLAIAETLDDTPDPREAIAAGLLHDLVNVAKDSPDRARASELSADTAATLLHETGTFDAPAIARITAAIRDHSFSRGAVPDNPLGRALQDADRLDALGAVGVLRTAATGGRMGARFYDPADPWATDRDLDDRRQTVDHFFAKLLRLPATMTTPAGRAEASRRADHMRTFLAWLGDEIGQPPPGQ